MKLFNRKQSQPTRQPKFGRDDQGYVFRRSRTLTGTTSTKVNPSAETRSQLKTDRLKTHELHQLHSRIVRILVGVIACIALITYLMLTYTSTITLRYTQPGGAPQTATYQQTIQGYFMQHPLERFGFALNGKQFAAELQAAHRELQAVDVDRSWYGGGVEFVMTFRRPVLVWEAGWQQFYVDDQGVAFTYDHLGGKYVAVSDQSGLSPSVTGGAVASNRFITFLGKMVGAVNAGGKGTVTDIIIPASTREAGLKLQGRGYPIKTHIDRDPLEQAGDILSALAWFDAKKQTPEYIDVRVNGRAYYK